MSVEHTPRWETASVVQLSEINVAGLATNDKRVPVAAPAAQEVETVFVDLWRSGSEHDFQPAGSALPHGGAPVDRGDRTAAKVIGGSVLSAPRKTFADNVVTVALTVLGAAFWLFLTAYLDGKPTETDAAEASAQTLIDARQDARLAARVASRSALRPLTTTEESRP